LKHITTVALRNVSVGLYFVLKYFSFDYSHIGL